VFLLKGNVSQSELEQIRVPEGLKGQSKARSVSRAQVLLGKSLFFGKGQCSTCHSLHNRPEYSVLGPALAWRGLSDPQSIKESILQPNSSIATGYGTATCVLQSGKSVSGRVVRVKDDSISLMVHDPTGEWRLTTINRSELDEEIADDFPPPAESPMPSAATAHLTADELEAIVQFILSLN